MENTYQCTFGLEHKVLHPSCSEFCSFDTLFSHRTTGTGCRCFTIDSWKAEAVEFNDEFDVVVVSDTLVEDPDDEQAALGKPASREQAVAMLLRLRGRRHRVWSATMVHAMGNWHSSVEFAVVEIEDFSDDALVELIESDSWVGKAGGYDLAGMMGKYAQLIEGTEPAVLGFTQSSLDLLDDVQSLLSMSRS